MEPECTSPQVPSGLYWPRVNLQTSEGPEYTKAVAARTREFRYVRRLYEQNELYDLLLNPGGLHSREEEPAGLDQKPFR